ncbi:hypothetical protein FRC11_001181 [Ceratobasidium sp. 423]|nr:hypothetical protein FRC11_001181 [Ceratobasidium sp. 423]
MHPSATNLPWHLFIEKRWLSPHFKFMSQPHLSYLRPLRPDTDQPPLLVGVHSSSAPQPVGNNYGNLPEYEQIPRSSRLHNSLFGFTQCLGSQPEAHNASLDPYGIPNMSESQFNGSQVSNATEEAYGLGNDSRQHLNSDIHESIRDLRVAQLDPRSLSIGVFLGYQAALGHPSLIGSAGTSQDHIPGSFSMSPDPPIPLTMHPGTQGVQGNFPDPRHASAYEIQDQAQLFFSAPNLHGTSLDELFPFGEDTDRRQTDASSRFTGTYVDSSLNIGESLIYAKDHEYSIPSGSTLEPTRSTASFANDGVVGAFNLSTDLGVIQRVTLQTGALGHEPSTSVDSGQDPDLSSKICPKCKKAFNRSSDLQDHMHKHDRKKRG